MNSNQKGEIGEIATIKRLKELNFGVYTPFGENTRSDIIMENKTVQFIKSKLKQDIWNKMVALSKQTYSQLAGDGYNKDVYTSDEIDAFVIYCVENDRCYWIDIDNAPNKGIHLRLKSKQDQKNIRWAEDYELKNVLK